MNTKKRRRYVWALAVLAVILLLPMMGITPSLASTVGNPGAETNLSGWNSSGSGAGTTLVRDTSVVHSGMGSFKLTAGTAGADAVLNDSPDWVLSSPGASCTATAWVKGVIGASVRLRLREYAGSTNVGAQETVYVLPDTDWHQVSTTKAVTVGNKVDLVVRNYHAATVGQVLEVDDVTEDCGGVSNSAPTAKLSVTPASGQASLAVTADASASSDVDGNIASYTFAWGDGSTSTGPQASAVATHSFSTAGSFTVTVTVTDSGGLSGSASQVVTATAPSGSDPVVTAAGDISCVSGAMSTNCQQYNTAKLIQRINPDRVIALGDLQYGGTITAADFQAGYGPYADPVAHPSWGDLKAKTRPTVGSHEYNGLKTADGYFSYWNGSPTADGTAGPPDKGYYTEELGTWHIVHANSQRGYRAGSAENLWLQNDLAAHAGQCVLVTWHHPKYSSGTHGNQTNAVPLFQTAYNGNADVLLSANDHLYERFAPQNASGGLDTVRGIRQFVVGTGGKGLYAWGTIKPNSEYRNNNTYGVIKLTLHASSYEWQYVTVADQVLDSGTQSCH